MALSGFPFPYDIGNLLGGAVRILYAPTSVAVPTDLDDIIDLTTPYAVNTGWVDLGATKDAFSYSRSFDTSGYEIQQTAGNVIEELTDLSRSFTVSFAEFKPGHLEMIENAPASVAGTGTQLTAFGSFTSITQHRFAFIAMRPKQAGTVEGGIRGRFFAGVAYRAQIAADEVSFDQAKGELTAAGVTFTMFPEPGQALGKEWGMWIDETAAA